MTVGLLRSVCRSRWAESGVNEEGGFMVNKYTTHNIDKALSVHPLDGHGSHGNHDFLPDAAASSLCLSILKFV